MLENGRSAPSASALRALSEQLGVSIDWIGTGNGAAGTVKS